MQKMICNYNNLSEVAEKIINLSEEELKWKILEFVKEELK
jgi:hypothetical protein